MGENKKKWMEEREKRERGWGNRIEKKRDDEIHKRKV